MFVFLWLMISGDGKGTEEGKMEEMQTQLAEREKEVKTLQDKLEAAHKEVCSN